MCKESKPVKNQLKVAHLILMMPQVVRYLKTSRDDSAAFGFLQIIEGNWKAQLKAEFLGLPGFSSCMDRVNPASSCVSHTADEGLWLLQCTGVKHFPFLLSVNFWFGCADNSKGEGSGQLASCGLTSMWLFPWCQMALVSGRCYLLLPECFSACFSKTVLGLAQHALFGINFFCFLFALGVGRADGEDKAVSC